VHGKHVASRIGGRSSVRPKASPTPLNAKESRLRVVPRRRSLYFAVGTPLACRDRHTVPVGFANSSAAGGGGR
jgi:hypothetical protein